MTDKKTVLITGAARGIGKALAKEFALNNYNVIINYLENTEAADKTASEIIASKGSARVVKADISKAAKVKALITDILSNEGHIDVLVNNAGITKNRTIAKMTDEEWDEVIATNLTAPFYLMRECAKPMIKQKGGSIINIGSIIGRRGFFGSANYAASKNGLVTLTKTAAKELGRFHICVNAVLPGFHKTDMAKTTLDGYEETVKNESTLGTTTDINELAKFIVLLAGFKTVSGQTFNIDSRVI